MMIQEIDQDSNGEIDFEGILLFFIIISYYYLIIIII